MILGDMMKYLSTLALISLKLFVNHQIQDRLGVGAEGGIVHSQRLFS